MAVPCVDRARLPDLPVSDRDYLAEARALAVGGTSRFLPERLHLLAYEHFVRSLLATHWEQAELIAQWAEGRMGERDK